MSDGQNIAAVRQDTINHTVASFIDLPDIVMLILLHHPTGEWMLGKRIGTACQPVNEALRILRLVFSDVIMKLLQTVAGFDRPVCCQSGKPNCLRTAEKVKSDKLRRLFHEETIKTSKPII